LTPEGRLRLVRRITRSKVNVREAAAQAQVSRQTAYKWLRRYEQEGPSGLEDRSSRPHRSPFQTPPSLVRRIAQLRRRRKTAWEIAAELEMAPSTVSKVLKQIGLGRLWRIAEAERPPARYEHEYAGSMVHIDAKKLARIQGVGHRIHGDHSRKHPGGGYEVVFVCVDDHSRFAYAEVLPAENKLYATAFLRRALRRFRDLGIEVKRVLSDNAKCYSSKPFRALCAQHNVRQSFTRPYTPQTNGKAERFIQTMTRRWAYRRPYRTSAIRTAALPAWINDYNHRRPHRALGMRPPIARLRESREQRP
jgi:transposase InsO family protein